MNCPEIIFTKSKNVTILELDEMPKKKKKTVTCNILMGSLNV